MAAEMLFSFPCVNAVSTSRNPPRRAASRGSGVCSPAVLNPRRGMRLPSGSIAVPNCSSSITAGVCSGVFDGCPGVCTAAVQHASSVSMSHRLPSLSATCAGGRELDEGAQSSVSAACVHGRTRAAACGISCVL
eukprot:5153352-Prymnesium_polylepis.1